MNTPGSVWSNLPLSTGIAALVCYAGVFNDVIGIEELASKLGVSGQDEFHAALNELHRQAKLVLRDGFAGLPGLEDRIAIKASQIAKAHQLIDSRLDVLQRLGRNPLIRFVGISGSLAAGNPTRDRNNRLDIDIFVITRRQCLYLYKILSGLRNLFAPSREEPELCINYVMDASNLMIPNRNFYTATEIRNLIPVSGLDAYGRFLQVNNWVAYYYPGALGGRAPVAATRSGNLVNQCLYLVYTMLQCVKWQSLDPFRRFSIKTNPHIGFSAELVGAPYGGYQALAQKKFSRLVETWFPGVFDPELIEKLFPDELSAEIRRGDIDLPTIIVDAGLGTDYSKYG